MTAPDCPSCGLLARRSGLYDSGWGCPDGCGEVRPDRHRCHLERQATDYGTAARAVCSCGWTGHWYVTGARAVEESLRHQGA